MLATPQQGYENGFILKAHCKSAKPDSYWRNMHATAAREEMLIREAITEQLVQEQFVWIARFNRRIASEQLFSFFSPRALSALFVQSGFTVQSMSQTYATQNLLIQATKH